MSNARGAKRAAYQKEFNARPENVRKRVLNNQARAEAMKKGLVHKGDGKDVDHIKPLDNGGGNKGNTRVVDEKTNRGWRKGSGSYNPGKQVKK